MGGERAGSRGMCENEGGEEVPAESSVVKSMGSGVLVSHTWDEKNPIEKLSGEGNGKEHILCV